MIRRILIVPDSHFPYVSTKAWRLMLKAAAGFGPDETIVMGDFADFYCVSSHSKDPRRRNDLEWEVDETKKGLAQLMRLGAKTNIFIAGNHEDRLERYLAQRAPELFGTVKIEGVLDLKAGGWKYVPYKKHYKLGKVYFTHDTGTAGRNAHQKSMDVYQGSVVIGHCHRMEFSVTGNADGPPQVGAMFGWLGDFEAVDYMHSAKSKRDWVHGFGIGYHDTATGYVYLVPVPIINDTCCLEGRIYRV